MDMIKKIGFGGGCHWCTEAIFQALIGVKKVDQGWIASVSPYQNFSEGVIVYYDDCEISLKVLIEIHLLTHSSTSLHKMREKYRSAIYYFNTEDKLIITDVLEQLEIENNLKYITQNIPYIAFKQNIEEQLNYYTKNKTAPFCKTYIDPKLSLLKKQYAKVVR
jgi:peptide-methionine (S)-S-oxide reductase